MKHLWAFVVRVLEARWDKILDDIFGVPDEHEKRQRARDKAEGPYTGEWYD